MAECSESTGIIWPGRAFCVTSVPPATRDSLLAKAKYSPISRVATVALSPKEPTKALSTVSAGAERTRCSAASAPLKTEPPRAADTSAAASSLATATWSNERLRLRACSMMSCGLEPPAAIPTTSNLSGLSAMTSRACVPIEPVEPRMSIR